MPGRLTYVDAPEPNAAMLREAQSFLSRAAEAETSQRPAMLDRAADLFREAGAHARALRALGEAVDCLLEVSRLEPAIAHCRRVIRLYPNVVRARCTLTYLLAEQGDVVNASAEMDQYVAAAQKAGVVDIAIRRLRLLAAHPVSSRLRPALSRAFATFGATEDRLPLMEGVPLSALLRAEPQSLADFIARPTLLQKSEAQDLPWLDTTLH